MIIDHISRAHLYPGLPSKLAAGLRWLQTTDVANLAPAKFEIDGSDVYSFITEYETKTAEQAKWEAHRKYYDIQFMVKGEERIGYAPLEACRLGEYDESKDFQQIAQVRGDFLLLTPGLFMILGPHDAHCPGLFIDAVKPVKKAIVKVRV